MDIDKLEAGRELDVLVAEKVMGLVWKEGTGVGRYVGQRVEGWGFPDFLWVNPDGLPEYSTNIAAAWEVVEKLQEIIPPRWMADSYDWFYLDAPDRQDCKLWGAGWRYAITYEGEGTHLEAGGETAPLAICRAALKAVNAE